MLITLVIWESVSMWDAIISKGIKVFGYIWSVSALGMNLKGFNPLKRIDWHCISCNRFWFMMWKNFTITAIMLIQAQRAGVCVMPGIIFSSFGLNEKTLFLCPSALVGCFALPCIFMGVWRSVDGNVNSSFCQNHGDAAILLFVVVFFCLWMQPFGALAALLDVEKLHRMNGA